MTEYLDQLFPWNSPELVAVFDEAPLWSAVGGRLLFDHVPLRRGMVALDIGCGAGFPLLELAGRLGPSGRVYGLDMWLPAMRHAQRKIAFKGIGGARLVGGDGSAIPFAAGTFDLIVANFGINNFADPAGVLAECARVCKPGARLAFTTNLRGHMAEFYAAFADAAQDIAPAILPALEAHIAHRVTLDEARALLESAGFRVRAVHDSAYVMRSVDGSALLRDAFIRMAFLESWQQIAAGTDQHAFFRRLEDALNARAASAGELALTVPLAYIEGEHG